MFIQSKGMQIEDKPIFWGALVKVKNTKLVSADKILKLE